MSRARVFIANETKRRPPRIGIGPMKEYILGKTYRLSVIFVGDAKSQTLNRAYRGKNKPTNILSFPITKGEGELYVNLSQIARERTLFNRSLRNLVSFLLIHGMFHLKGFEHGSTMEHKERLARTRFKIG